jgi:hypothetical protein
MGMPDEHESDAAGLIVYVDHSDVQVGRVEELREGIRRLVGVIEELEPQLIAYGFHLAEPVGRLTVTVVHPDSASLEFHLEVGREQFGKLADLLTLRQIEVYGAITARARELLEQKAAMLGGSSVTVVERFAGFARLPRP